MTQDQLQHVANLLASTVRLAMKQHPVGSSAAIWAARETINDCAMEGASITWEGPRKAVMRLNGGQISIEIPGAINAGNG